MKRLSLIAVCMFCTMVSAMAQQSSSQVQALAKQLSTARIQFSYSLNPEGKPSETVTGKAVVQKGAFSITMNGVELLCDGKASYTINPSSKEIYIEKAVKIPPYLTDPNNLAKALSGLNTNATSISGKFTNPEDKKQVFDFTISSLLISEPSESQGEFSLDTSKYGNDWVITDMR